MWKKIIQQLVRIASAKILKTSGRRTNYSLNSLRRPRPKKQAYQGPVEVSRHWLVVCINIDFAHVLAFSTHNIHISNNIKIYNAKWNLLFHLHVHCDTCAGTILHVYTVLCIILQQFYSSESIAVSNVPNNTFDANVPIKTSIAVINSIEMIIIGSHV